MGIDKVSQEEHFFFKRYSLITTTIITTINYKLLNS